MKAEEAAGEGAIEDAGGGENSVLEVFFGARRDKGLSDLMKRMKEKM